MGDDLYYFRSILRHLRELQELVTTAESFYGPTIGTEVLSDNIDWLDCHVNALEQVRASRAAQSKGDTQ